MFKKKPELLKLIQRGDRSRPSIYRLNDDENLCLHLDEELTAEICNSKGHHIRPFNPKHLKKMGYSYAKLLRGEREDQFIAPKITKDSVINFLGAMCLATVLGVAGAIVSSITGCSDYVFQKIEDDIATTTVYPVENYQRQIERKQANEHANRYLAKAYGRKSDNSN